MDKKEVQVGRLEADLIEKVDNYTALTNDSRINFIRTLLTEFFRHKVVTKEFIVPERPFYFNMNVLLEEGSVEATTIKPSTDFNNYYTVKKIPNNLDSFSSKNKTYCYNEVPVIHKGIFIYYFFSAEANPVPLVFDYNSTDYAEELTISVIKISDLNFLIESEEDVETIETIVKDVEANVEFYNSEGASANTIDFMASISKVIEDFKGRRIIDLIVKYNVNELDLDSETISEIANSEIATITNPNSIENLLKDKNELYNLKKKLNSIVEEIENIERNRPSWEEFSEMELSEEEKEDLFN